MLTVGNVFSATKTISQTRGFAVTSQSTGHAFTWINGWSEGSSGSTDIYALGALDSTYTSGSYYAVYCIQPGGHWNQSTSEITYTYEDNDPYFDNFKAGGKYNNKVLSSSDIQTLIGEIGAASDTSGNTYAYTGVVSNSMSNDAIARYIATQVLIWETIVGERSASFYLAGTDEYYNETGYTWSDLCGNTSCERVYAYVNYLASSDLQDTIKYYYNLIVNAVQANHVNKPTFSTKTYELDYDSSTGKYTTTITDANATLDYWKFTCSNSNVTITESGNNKLTITSTTSLSSNLKITGTRTDINGNTVSINSRSFITYGTGSSSTEVQETVLYQSSTSAKTDPCYFYVHADGVGSLELTKADLYNGDGTTSAGKTSKYVSGSVTFKVYELDGEGGSETGNSYKVTTDENGKANVLTGLAEGWYRVVEVTNIYGMYPTNGKDEDGDGFLDEVTYIDVYVEKEKTNTFTFYNTGKMFSIPIAKWAEDGAAIGTS